jgi:hypothetical protein
MWRVLHETHGGPRGKPQRSHRGPVLTLKKTIVLRFFHCLQWSRRYLKRKLPGCQIRQLFPAAFFRI